MELTIKRIIIVLAIFFGVPSLIILYIPFLPPNPDPPEGFTSGYYPITDDPYLCSIYGGTWDDKQHGCYPMNLKSCEEFNGLDVDCMKCKSENSCPEECVPGCFLTRDYSEEYPLP